jgi:hypothetical protein
MIYWLIKINYIIYNNQFIFYIVENINLGFKNIFYWKFFNNI